MYNLSWGYSFFLMCSRKKKSFSPTQYSAIPFRFWSPSTYFLVLLVLLLQAHSPLGLPAAAEVNGPPCCDLHCRQVAENSCTSRSTLGPSEGPECTPKEHQRRNDKGEPSHLHLVHSRRTYGQVIWNRTCMSQQHSFRCIGCSCPCFLFPSLFRFLSWSEECMGLHFCRLRCWEPSLEFTR